MIHRVQGVPAWNVQWVKHKEQKTTLGPNLLLGLIWHCVVDFWYEVLRHCFTTYLCCIDIVYCILRLLLWLDHATARWTHYLALFLSHIWGPAGLYLVLIDQLISHLYICLGFHLTLCIIDGAGLSFLGLLFVSLRLICYFTQQICPLHLLLRCLHLTVLLVFFVVVKLWEISTRSI